MLRLEVLFGIFFCWWKHHNLPHLKEKNFSLQKRISVDKEYNKKQIQFFIIVNSSS